MPVVISRSSGEILSALELTSGQRSKLWEKYLMTYINKHPEILKQEDNPCQQ